MTQTLYDCIGFLKGKTVYVQGKTDAVSARFVRKFMSKGVPKGCSLGRMAILVYRKSILSLRTPVLRDNATNQGKIDMETEHGTIRARFLLKS